MRDNFAIGGGMRPMWWWSSRLSIIGPYATGRRAVAPRWREYERDDKRIVRSRALREFAKFAKLGPAFGHGAISSSLIVGLYFLSLINLRGLAGVLPTPNVVIVGVEKKLK
jgi:hypothetical protein